MANSESKNATFNERLDELLRSKNANNVFLTQEKYRNVVQHVNELKSVVSKKTPADYKLLKKYDVVSVGGAEKLIFPMLEGAANVKYYADISEIYNIIDEAHLRIGHGRRNRMVKEINLKYKNITEECIMVYLNLCRQCQEKASKKRKGLVVKPMVFSEMNSRGRFYLIDMQTQQKWV